MEKLFQNFGEKISIFSALLFVGSFLNLYSYYQMFGIDVNNYIDASEVIFSFSALFNIVLAGGLFLLLPYFLALMTKHPDESVFNDDTDDVKSGFSLIVDRVMMVILIVTTIVLVIEDIPVMKNLMFFFLFSYAYFFLLRKRLKPVRIAITLSCFLGVFVIANNFFKYKTIKRGESLIFHLPLQDVEFKTEDFVLRSSKDFRYIGSSKSFIFFYDSYSKKVMIYPSSKIIWSSFKNRLSDR